jgi:hypothetical protein
MVFIAWRSFLHSPLPSPPHRVTWQLASTIHPASSGSQGWGRVLGCCSFCGVHCVAFIALRSFLHPPPSPPRHVTWPLAPTIHPASSGSQGWGRVLGCRSFRSVHSCILSSPPLPSPSCDVAVSTCDPPCEQWLAGLGWVLGRTSSSVLHIPHFHPASSCSRWRLGLLWWLSFRLVCFVSWGWLRHGGVLTSWLAWAVSLRRFVISLV